MNLDFTQTKQMELKREYSDNLLKTVVAFANYSGGALIIGIDEKNKEVIGVSDYINSKLNIENKINDTIKPRPHYEINVLFYDGKNILEILVYSGKNTPYLYKEVACQRHDTSTIPVDQTELMELSLKGKNISYDLLEIDKRDLKFSVLEKN